MSILSFINSDNYRTYNLHMAKILGSVNAAIMLSELVQRYEYHKERNELIYLKKYEGEWFYFTCEKCQERTALSRDEQDTALNVLIRKGLLIKVQAGLPGKRHFQLNQLEIVELFTNSKNFSSLRDSRKLDCGNPANCIEEIPQTIKEHYKEHIQEEQQQDAQARDSANAENAAASFQFSKIKKQQQKDPPTFDCLKEIDIPELDKQEISQRYEEQVVKNAIAWAQHPETKINTTLVQAIKWACKEKPQIPVSKEENERENKKFAKQFDGKKSRTSTVNVLSKGVEISQNGSGHTSYISYDEKGFKEQLENALRKHEFRIKKDK